MSGTPGTARLTRADAPALAGLVALALALHAGVAVVAAARQGIPLGALGVFHDGHLYLEIARSFPLPYAAEGRSYLGQAPAYPALIAALHALTPDRWVDWGVATLLAAWLPAAGSAAAFYALCRVAGLAPFWPSVLFVLANPRWLSVSATPHAEPLAMLLVLLAACAGARGRLPACAAWLSLAVLARFPALLIGAALAWLVLVQHRRRDARGLALLGVPLVPLLLLHLYLAWRVPGFRGVWSEHRVFWEADLTWPFAALATPAATWQFFQGTAAYWITYASVAVYLLALAAGLRRAERDCRALAVWIAAVVLFHASLTGYIGAWDFTRLALLAWPAALLVLWRWLGPRLPAAVAAGLAAAGGAFGAWWAVGQTGTAVAYQSRHQPYLADTIAHLDEDAPRWIDFERLRRERP